MLADSFLRSDTTGAVPALLRQHPAQHRTTGQRSAHKTRARTMPKQAKRCVGGGVRACLPAAGQRDRPQSWLWEVQSQMGAAETTPGKQSRSRHGKLTSGTGIRGRSVDDLWMPVQQIAERKAPTQWLHTGNLVMYVYLQWDLLSTAPDKQDMQERLQGPAEY